MLKGEFDQYLYLNRGLMISELFATNLIRMSTNGPAVPLNESPTKSPVTATLCASESLPTWRPCSVPVSCKRIQCVRGQVNPILSRPVNKAIHAAFSIRSGIMCHLSNACNNSGYGCLNSAKSAATPVMAMPKPIASSRICFWRGPISDAAPMSKRSA